MNPVKCILIGNPGVGKTSSLVSLVKAGYKLAIIDTDNGSDILLSLLTSKERKNVFVEVITNEIKATVAGPVAAGGLKINEVLALFSSGKFSGETFGPVKSWGQEMILVQDGLTSLGDLCLQQVAAMKGRKVGHFQQSDWGDAIGIQEGIVQFVAQKSVKCNVILTAHLKYLYDKDGAIVKGLPSALGKLFPGNIGRFFNNVFLVESSTIGKTTKRTIATAPTSLIDIKVSNPNKISASLPIETGMATIFKALLKENGNE